VFVNSWPKINTGTAFRHEWWPLGASERSEPILEGPGTQFRRVPAHFHHCSTHKKIWNGNFYGMRGSSNRRTRGPPPP